MSDESNKADDANAKLAALRSVAHNGTIYQADDVDYMLALAETQGRGLGAISPRWFREQAKLIKGTLAQLTAQSAELERLRGELAEAERAVNALATGKVTCNHDAENNVWWAEAKGVRGIAGPDVTALDAVRSALNPPPPLDEIVAAHVTPSAPQSPASGESPYQKFRECVEARLADALHHLVRKELEGLLHDLDVLDGERRSAAGSGEN